MQRHVHTELFYTTQKYSTHIERTRANKIETNRDGQDVLLKNLLLIKVLRTWFNYLISSVTKYFHSLFFISLFIFYTYYTITIYQLMGVCLQKVGMKYYRLFYIKILNNVLGLQVMCHQLLNILNNLSCFIFIASKQYCN